MPLVTSEKMLAEAREGGYAVGAFNVENMEMVKAVIAAAEEVKAPVMLQNCKVRYTGNLFCNGVGGSEKGICSGLPALGSRQQF